MALEIVTPAATPPTLNVLLYGPPGTGKTVGACSAPGPVLVLNAEGPGGLRKSRELYGDEQIVEAPFRGKVTLEEAYLRLRDGKAKERTVVLDTVGEAYRVLLEEVGGDSPRIQDYGTVNTLLERFVRSARDLDVNVVLVAHEELVRDDLTGETLRRPVTGGKKLPAQAMAQVDVVGYTGVLTHDDGRVEYVAQLVTSHGRLCKDRSGRLGTTRPLDLSEWVKTATAAPAARKAAA